MTFGNKALNPECQASSLSVMWESEVSIRVSIRLEESQTPELGSGFCLGFVLELES